ncbi:trehalose-phosphatase [Candidatus Desantisbacteria bacterium]|nr:trehalose-phosphatase [Candidatus Desantisbacteria bacterium]
MEYLFRKWDDIKNILRYKYLLIFCDFDGTLTPIAKTPEKAVISKNTKELLRKLSQISDCKIVIISGREIKYLKNKIQLKNIIYSGNHGLEIDGYGFKFKALVSKKYKNVLKIIKNSLINKFSDINGILLEDKDISLSIHYRLVNKNNIPLVKAIINDAVLLYKKNMDIKVKNGKKVFEIMPPIEWNKGKSVSQILKKQQNLFKNKNVYPIYFGDDTTDEDAFEILRNKGITIFVGKTKLSKAKYYLKDTKEVVKVLKCILEIRK